MEFPFIKMHGLGNDFVMLEKLSLNGLQGLASLAKKVSNRRLSIGCDQLILYQRQTPRKYLMEVFNADGSKAEACGNATRCLAWLAWEQFQESQLSIEVAGRTISCLVDKSGKVSANMGEALFEAQWMPPSCALWQLARMYKLSPRGITCVDMGNPHLVIFCDSISEQETISIGQPLSKDPAFKSGVNVNFASFKAGLISLLVWERGSGLSLACGSGACATFATACKLGFVQGTSASVHFQLGNLEMSLSGANVIMSGPVSKVASGVCFLET